MSAAVSARPSGASVRWWVPSGHARSTGRWANTMTDGREGLSDSSNRSSQVAPSTHWASSTPTSTGRPSVRAVDEACGQAAGDLHPGLEADCAAVVIDAPDDGTEQIGVVIGDVAQHAACPIERVLAPPEESLQRRPDGAVGNGVLEGVARDLDDRQRGPSRLRHSRPEQDRLAHPRLRLDRHRSRRRLGGESPHRLVATASSRRAVPPWPDHAPARLAWSPWGDRRSIEPSIPLRWIAGTGSNEIARRARLRVTPSTSTPWPAAPARRAARLVDLRDHGVGAPFRRPYQPVDDPAAGNTDTRALSPRS